MMITADTLSGLDGIAHGFFTREGGVSTGLYEGLNCGLGSRDLSGSVHENRGRAMDRLGFPRDALLTVFQKHTPDCVVVNTPWDPANPPEADAMATSVPGLVLGIVTADCAPVLFADPVAKVIGAAHAGWRGALDGVLESTVFAMEQLGATRDNIRAAVGPCIMQGSYEVAPDFPAPFIEVDESDRIFFKPSYTDGHFLFDLPGYALSLLKGMGIKQAQVSGHDTYSDDELFYSYRRATHQGEPDYGRQLSAIALKG